MDTEVCIVGGGPAGLVLALCLGRQGRRVTVFEMTRSYTRSFRGESIQPDTVDMLHELGLTAALRHHGWMETHGLTVIERGRQRLRVDLGAKPYRYRYTVDIPQSVLLGILTIELEALDNVEVLRGARVTGLIQQDDAVVGVRYAMGGAQHERLAKVTVAADGRYSALRDLAGIIPTKVPLSRDVLWCKFPRPANFPPNRTRILLNGPHHIIALPTYPDLIRCGVNIPKGSFGELRKQDIGVLHAIVDQIDPAFGDHFRHHVQDWTEVSLLDIFTATVQTWGRRGLVLVGDAAHTVTPLLGQGVNLAIEDAYVLASMLTDAFTLCQDVDEAFIARFQAIRQPQVDLVLRVQMFQERLLSARSHGALALRRLYYLIIDNMPALQSRMSDALIYRRQKACGHYA